MNNYSVRYSKKFKYSDSGSYDPLPVVRIIQYEAGGLVLREVCGRIWFGDVGDVANFGGLEACSPFKLEDAASIPADGATKSGEGTNVQSDTSSCVRDVKHSVLCAEISTHVEVTVSHRKVRRKEA